jgi:choline dehydrogenase
VDAPDLQVTFWTYSVAQRDAQGVVLHPFPGFTANAVILRPQSRGTVRIANADPQAMPSIRYNHLAQESDRTTLVDGLKLVRRILRMPAMAAYAGDELAPGAATADDAALLEYARRTGGSVYHPVGTCRMGSDPLAVVDDRLRVHGVRGLRVADASIMPAIVSGNTNAPTIMIAERAADWMLADAASMAPAEYL